MYMYVCPIVACTCILKNNKMIDKLYKKLYNMYISYFPMLYMHNVYVTSTLKRLQINRTITFIYEIIITFNKQRKEVY